MNQPNPWAPYSGVLSLRGHASNTQNYQGVYTPAYPVATRLPQFEAGLALIPARFQEHIRNQVSYRLLDSTQMTTLFQESVASFVGLTQGNPVRQVIWITDSIAADRRDSFIHEWGHVLDKAYEHRFGIQLRAEATTMAPAWAHIVAQEVANVIEYATHYAWSNNAEFVAEVFKNYILSTYLANGDALKTTATNLFTTHVQGGAAGETRAVAMRTYLDALTFGAPPLPKTIV